MVEERRRFDDYIETYNTASFPSRKYYDLKLWEQKQMEFKKGSD